MDSLQDPRALTIRLKTSKTDPFRVGVDVCIGRTDCDLCPVAAVLAYMVLRGRGKDLSSVGVHSRGQGVLVRLSGH